MDIAARLILAPLLVSGLRSSLHYFASVLGRVRIDRSPVYVALTDEKARYGTKRHAYAGIGKAGSHVRWKGQVGQEREEKVMRAYAPGCCVLCHCTASQAAAEAVNIQLWLT